MKIHKRSKWAGLLLASASASASSLLVAGAVDAAPAKPAAAMPQLVQKDGKFAFMVDGAPFLMLAGQANNSSNYPAALPKVWPAIADMHANTLVMPVAWEQVEPTEGHFDFSFVDTLVQQARQHGVRLDILWFGSWKNTGASYAPQWVQRDNKRFPRMINKDGSTSYCLSPHAETTREADKKAYVALLSHLKAIDPQHTVILLQIENESGVYGSVRDYSPKAEALFKGPVPAALIQKMGTRALKPSGSWAEVFGDDADEYFQAWSVASYAEDLARAGKAILPLPTYMNDALRDALHPQKPGSYASGGPTYNVLDIYKVAAPHIDMEEPDLYSHASDVYEANLKLYGRPDNALFVAETGNAAMYAPKLYSVLGHQGIGFDPFGMDYTGYTNHPLGDDPVTFGPDEMKPFARVYASFAPMQRVWARLSFESQVWGVSEPDDHSTQTLDLGANWSAKVQYRLFTFGLPEWDTDHKAGFPEGSETPRGGVAVARLDDHTFLVTGTQARITFDAGPANKDKGVVQTIEEGHFDAAGKWVFDRVWNGDETDYGLNFTAEPVVLKVTLSTYDK